MARTKKLPLNLETTVKFVQVCGTTFGWGDLSDDMVMDLGCGKELYCARAILDSFPNVKFIIALDGNVTQFQEVTFSSPKILHYLADILKRRDIREYEGKIDKVISSHVLHQIPDKQQVFKNVYRLLKPGGEAAFLFTSSYGLYNALFTLKQDPKYRAYFKGSDLFKLYSCELKAEHYRHMLGEIGFKVIEITEEKDNFPVNEFRKFERFLFHAVSEAFDVPPKLVAEINKAAINLYRAMYLEKKVVYAATEMSIFVAKPSDSDSKCSSS